jgi:hypothetical protein
MKTLVKSLAIILTLGCFAVPAEAKGNGQNRAVQKANQQKEAEKRKEKQERDTKREAVDKYLAKKDTNHDGSLTRDEFLVGEKDAAKANLDFDHYDANHDRRLERNEILALLGM